LTLGLPGRGIERLCGRVAIAWAAIALAGLTSAASAVSGDDLIGEPTIHITDGEETLLEVARDNDLGILEILAANPGIDPWVPGEETSVLLPTQHILPDAPRDGIVINLAELRLYFFPGSGAAPQTHAIGIGREGFTTPLGETRVVRKSANPTWRPTPATRADNPALPAAVPPGPDNPMGQFALYLGWPTYAIHGTNKPPGVGRRVSRGCIRLYPEQIAALYPQVPVGTRVTVVDQPVKLGWHGGQLYMEVHPELSQLDQMERGDTFVPEPLPDVRPAVLTRAGAEAGRLDWPVIDVAIRQRLGIPVRITR
jgi:L,D-transpeptidase ErfK/SrfK